MSNILQPTPQERLAISRKAIVRHMNKERETESPSEGDYEGIARGNEGGSSWGVFKRAIRAWWHHHPANVALDVAAPVVSSYVRNNPIKTLGIAAGVGAAVIVLKPWRLVSMGGLLLATMKSSDITGIVLSMLSPSPEHSDNHTEPQ